MPGRPRPRTKRQGVAGGRYAPWALDRSPETRPRTRFATLRDKDVAARIGWAAWAATETQAAFTPRGCTESIGSKLSFGGMKAYPE